MKRARLVVGGTQGAPGGTEHVAACQKRALERSGWEVDWLSPADLPRVRRSARYPGLNTALAALAMGRHVRSLPRVDVTLSHGLWGLGSRGPRVHVYHGTFAGLADGCRAGLPRLDYLVLRWVNGLLEKLSGHRCRPVAVSQPVAAEAAGYYRVPNCRVIHNSVDPEMFAGLPAPTACRRRWELPEDRFLVLLVGRMDFGKGREVLREMLPLVPEDVLFVLAAPTASGLEAFPAARIRRLSAVPYEELPSLYAACDVLLSTSLYEGFGLTFIEAWAAGRAIVSHQVGLLRELQGRHPALDEAVAPIGDANRLAAAVARFRETPAFGQEQAEWGRQLVREHFHSSRLEAQYHEAVEEALSGRSTAVKAEQPLR